MNAPQPLAARLQLPRRYRVVHADADGRAAALRLRRAVFCEEQGLFAGDDADDIDRHALTLIARPLAEPAAGPGPVVGTVRIHRLAPRVWQGSRLAVAADFRRVGAIGGALIQLAVRSANTLGCDRFVAQVQARNVPLFERLHWRSVEALELHGQPHHLMEADLAHYPAFAAGEAMQVELQRGG
ncbi:GNAT family N-acetyltransferase [Azoarcus indigens]|uniref:Putative N-acetyltransferase (TIGR04045 family) n=1 Tax=Azoarcus indigens TaxID=29545 RepID=A0A4V3BML1_9RHOO|nr:MSMEG_0567/Sll0786 family nitrogen starvation N-acetyltransferase [Azoarcus indigens]NMG64713.1 GNAT family N-acetyltransferase [Azoarcus indigens]TDN50902.1 putative N-acetyltransferase (TIGR04045 family) [Azoarcus indigens]